MATSRPKKQSKPAHDASDTARQADRACKILPFRQARSRKCLGNNELVPDCAAVEPADEDSLGESRSLLAACLPEYPHTISCHGCAREAGEPTARTSSPVPRWLKRVLLMSTFTAWAAAAIVLTIALS
jgi:hypothetical protein